MRCDSEALRLQWQDVDFFTGFIRVVSGRDGHRTKTGKSRDIPMTPRLTAALRDYFAARSIAVPRAQSSQPSLCNMICGIAA